MKHFTYLTGVITEDNYVGKANHIAHHFSSGGYNLAIVEITNGGTVYIQKNDTIFSMSTEYRGKELERDYYSLEAALLDGMAFSTDFVDFASHHGPYDAPPTLDNLRIYLGKHFGLDK